MKGWLLVLFPAVVCAQVLTPPAQDFALHFSGNAAAFTDQISVGSAFTLEAWVYLEAASPSAMIMGKPYNPLGNNPFYHYALMFDSTGRRPSFVQSTGQPGTTRTITAATDLPIGVWMHVAATLDAGAMRLYVNGQVAASGVSAGAPAGAQVPFALGGGTPDGNAVCCTLSGALREARVWSRALSASELGTYASQKLTGNEPGLVVDWPLSQSSGSVANGIGPRVAPLTIKGATWSAVQILENGPYWETANLPTFAGVPGAGRPGGMHTTMVRNASGRLDIIIAYSQYPNSGTYSGDDAISEPVLFLRNDGNRVFTAVRPPQPTKMVFPRNSTIADFDGDGLEDVMIADHGFDAPPFPGAIARMLMQRGGEMRDETSVRLPAGRAFTHDACAADVNRDGSMDLFEANLSSRGDVNQPVLLLNDGRGNFHNAAQNLPASFNATTGPWFASCTVADVNQDGAPDLLLGGSPGVRDWLLLNDGRGNFSDASAASLPLKLGGLTDTTHGFAIGDFNRDGWIDAVATTLEGGQFGRMQLLINNGNGTFRNQDDAVLNTRVDTWFDKGYVTDFNHDGWPDLFVQANGSTYRIYQNMGGHFEDRTETLPIVSGGIAYRIADFDGDGRVDVLMTGFTNVMFWGKNLWPPVAVATPVITSVGMAGGAAGVVQNGWVEIKGTNLAPLNVGSGGKTWDTAKEFTAGRMPMYLDGVQVTINGKAAFVYYVSPTQLNVLVPLDGGLGTAQVVVTSGGRSSLPFSVDMRPAAPSFPLFGTSYLVATHADYTLIGPAALAAPGYTVTPAKPGDTIVLYGFGFGLPTTVLTNGAASQAGRLPEFPVIRIGGEAASVVYAGVISPGLYQINVMVPNTVPDGDNAVVATLQGTVSPGGVVIAVKR